VNDEAEIRRTGPSRRTVLAGGGLFAAFVASVGMGAVAVAAGDRARPVPAASPVAVPVTTPAPAPTPTLPPPLGAPIAGVQLQPANTWATQSLVQLPGTGEWFTTQSRRGTSGLLDPAGLAVGDIVVTRLAADGTFLDSMVLPDSGHGMGLVLKLEAGVRVVYSCWFASDGSGRLYDVVRIPYTPGVAARSSATPVVAGLGYPLDPSYDPSTDAVTVRHQGGGGPEYTRHTWSDFAAGDLSRPTGAVPTSDRPPVHQGFCSFGDRVFFYTGEATDAVGADPIRITEYSWTTGAVVGAPIDASGNSRQPDGTYPGGRIEPEGATIVDRGGSPYLVVGLTTGGGATRAPRTYPTYWYPFSIN
jgi:hypothetical protein